jgi:hypothetical protein
VTFITGTIPDGLFRINGHQTERFPQVVDLIKRFDQIFFPDFFIGVHCQPVRILARAGFDAQRRKIA